MDLRNCEIARLLAEEIESNPHLIEIDERELTAKQREEQRVMLADHVTELGRRLGAGRNKPCFCGSGKKNKHCCGAPGR